LQSIYHILNGDVLAEMFPSDLEGECIIMREVLMDGPISTSLDETFYQSRESFLYEELEADPSIKYSMVATELDKLKTIPSGSSVYLWFEFDLFCQVNYWACCQWLSKYNENLKLFWVAPDSEDWRGFGLYDTPGLRNLMSSARPLSQQLLQEYAHSLDCYKRKDRKGLLKFLAEDKITTESEAVLRAQLARLPDSTGKIYLDEVISRLRIASQDNFGKAFRLFSSEYGIYGMGDLQFRILYDRTDSGIGEEQ